jgi:outer membrane usher protein
VDYVGNRFEAEASHDLLMTDLDDPDAREQRSSLTLESSLAFAGGRLALGRPIDAEGSFALVYPHRSLAGKRVQVNPAREGPDAVADGLGPGVIDTQPYGDEQVEVEVDELPVGYDIGAGRFGLRPSLASGYALQVGSAASVSVLGTLQGPDGAPVALMGGQAIDLDDPAAPPVTVLSNSVGRFAAQPLRPGRYRIRMFTTPPLVAEIEVGEDAIGLVDVGTLTLRPE